MIRAIIIDDEQHCIDKLCSLLEEQQKDSLEISGVFTNVTDAVKGVNKIKPDLVFLDVQINDETGFDFLKKLNSISFDIIFTTAFEKYAVQAFKFSAIDYLLKPIDADDLNYAVEKLKNKISNEEMKTKVDVLFHNFINTQNGNKKITVPTINGLIILQVNEIIRCESDVNYTNIHLKDKSHLMVAKTLKEFEELLEDYNFFRIHNSHLVNLSYIKNYNKGKGGFVVLSDGTEIEVSSRRKDLFLQRLKNF
jgi:two-component system LytT family response regulator